MPSGNWDEYFGTRKWRVADEITGTDIAEPGTEFNADGTEAVTVEFKKGKFTIAGAKFHSPLSSARGQAGVVLQEVDPGSGADVTGSRVAVGVVVYRRARSQGAVR